MTKTAKDSVIGTVKGPGELPHEYLFITRDNRRSRVGEFVYYVARDGETERQIIGTIKARKMVQGLPDAFLSDPKTPPSGITGLIGLDADESSEIFEIQVETIGFFSESLGDFVNPRIPPDPGDQCMLASSQTLTGMLSSKKLAEAGSAHIGSLLTREQDEVPVVLSVKDVVSTHLAILASTGSGKSYTAGVLVEELMNVYNRAAVLIVDPHSEYKTLQALHGNEQFFGEDGYKPDVKIFTPDKVKVRFSTLTEADIRYLLPEGTSDKMSHFLRQAYRSLQDGPLAKKGLWGYHDLRDEVKKQLYGDDKNGGNQSSIEGLLWRLDSRFDRRDGIFSDDEHIPLSEL